MQVTVNKDNALWRIVDGEAVLISAATSYYYSLNRTGTFVWNLLADGPLTRDHIVSRVADHYGVAAAAVRDDVGALLDQLRAEDLIVEE
jgi:hypothetical protein